MKTPRTVLHQMAIDAWGSGTALLVLCLLLEAAERGFVSRFFNVLWLLLFVVGATLAVMATHPGSGTDDASHHHARGARLLLQIGSVSAGLAAWTLLPADLSVVWRGAASGAILLAALAAWPALSKNE